MPSEALYHTTLQATPGELVFGRDMILPIRFKTNWAILAQRKQAKINKFNAHENTKRQPFTYKIGDRVLLERPGILPKMSTPHTGPYVIQQTFTNGTVQIQKGVVGHRLILSI